MYCKGRSVIAIRKNALSQKKDYHPTWLIILFALMATLCLPSQAAAARRDKQGPTVPTGLIATPVGCSQVDLSWNASTDIGTAGLNGYYLYRNGVLVKKVLAPATSTSDVGLAGGTRFSYAVLALDNTGNKSAQTSPVYATTPPCASCNYAISPSGTSIGSGASGGLVTITAGGGCPWTPSSTVPSWLTCSPADGTGSGTLSWSATANASTSPRTGSLNIAGQTFTVNQAGVPCTYAISPSGANPSAAAVSGTITVTAGAGCSWTPLSSAPSWLTFSPASGSGSGGVTWSVTANASTSPRTGTLNIANQMFTITQAGAGCTYAISPGYATPGAAAASGTITVTADPGCIWTASSSSPLWLSCTSPSGPGSGTVTWSVTANTSCSMRSSMLTVAGKIFAVNQSAGAGTFAISPTSSSIIAAGGNGTVNVTAAADCNWTCSSSASWITVSAGGTGSGTATYTALPNTSSSARSATLTIAGQSFLLTQTGAACSYALSSTSASLGASGGNGTVNVTAGTDCSWTCSSGVSWVTVSAGGTGSGTATYSVLSNASSIARSTTLTIAGQNFLINQAGGVCSYALSATSGNIGASGGNGTVNVTAGFADCSWTCSAGGVSWVTVSAGGTGSGAATYSVLSNASSIARSATLTIAGKSFLLTQAGAACSYSLASSSGNIGASGGNGTVNVTAGPDCSWTCSSGVSWVTVSAGGTGSSAASYSVQANSSSIARSATLTIAGKSFLVTQAGATCSFALSVPSANMGANGGNGTVNVTAGPADCSWTCSSGVSWVTVSAGGTGSGTATYSVSANTSSSTRSTTLTIAGQGFLVTQGGTVCSYALSATSASVPAAGGTGTVNVTTGPDCSWTCSSGVSWITVSGGGNGSGPANYSAAANTSASSRSGTLTVAGQSFLLTQAGSTQPVTSWASCAGGVSDDRGTSLAVDSAGNVFVAGYFSGTADFGGSSLASVGRYDMFLAKYSAGGTVQWAKRFGGSGSTVAPVFIAIDGSGNIAVAGHFTGTADFGRGALSSAAYDIFVAEYLPDGSPRWAKRFGGAGDDIVTGTAIDKRNGEIVVAGTFTGTSDFSGGVGTALTSYYGGTDCFLARYSANGDHIWSKNFLNISSDRINAVAIDDSGNIVLTGTTDAFINFGGQDLSSAMFLVKLNGAGAHQWSKPLGNASPKALAVDSSGNIILTGIFGSPVSVGGATLAVAGSTDVFLAKYSSAGSHLWSEALGGAYSDNVCSVAVDGSGNVFLLGNFYYSTALGGSVLTGAGWDDVFVAKYASSGAHAWSQAFGGSATDVGAAITVDGAGAAIGTGVFQSSASFLGQSLTSLGANDIFLFRYLR